jgi:lipoprotein-anchoring transpeptidase ErfK/SrfK
MIKKSKKINRSTVAAKQAKFMYSLFIFGLVGMLFYGALLLQDIYARENNLNISTKTVEDIEQGDEMVINFSTAIDGRFDLRHIKIEPVLEIEPVWLSNKQLKVKIKGTPELNQKYKVTLWGIKTFWLNLKKDATLNFQAVRVPRIVNVYPVNNQKEVSFDTDIRISLDQALSKKLFLEIDINPDIEVEANLSKDRKNVEILPKKKLDQGQKYTINISAKRKSSDKVKQEIYAGNFITKTPPKIVYGFGKNGEPYATDNLTWEIASKISEGRYIDIDLTHQVMSIFEDGVRKGSYKVSTGKRSMKTPTGTFKVFSKVPRPWSAKYGLYMPYYLGFTYQGHGIHELPEWPSGYKEGTNHLGIPVSHGCVRLGVGPAKIVYDFASRGTPVVVYY